VAPPRAEPGPGSRVRPRVSTINRCDAAIYRRWNPCLASDSLADSNGSNKLIESQFISDRRNSEPRCRRDDGLCWAPPALSKEEPFVGLNCVWERALWRSRIIAARTASNVYPLTVPYLLYNDIFSSGSRRVYAGPCSTQIGSKGNLSFQSDQAECATTRAHGACRTCVRPWRSVPRWNCICCEAMTQGSSSICACAARRSGRGGAADDRRTFTAAFKLGCCGP